MKGKVSKLERAVKKLPTKCLLASQMRAVRVSNRVEDEAREEI